MQHSEVRRVTVASRRSIGLGGWLRLTTVAALALATAACQTNAATGRQQFLTMSSAQEQAIGDKEHPKLVRAFGGKFENRAIDDYVTQVGKSLDVFAETTDIAYSYTVLDSEIANAFALPGGYVHISRGLMALMNNEAELASVLAHEVGHITGRHSNERFSRGTAAQLGVFAAAVLTGSSQVAQVANTGAQLYLASYSRGQESESDRLGLRYMNAAGYDPTAMATMLAQLGRNSEILAKAAGREASQQFDMLSTHPQTPQRVADATNAAATIPNPGQTLRRNTFLSKIDGMPFGPSAEAGAIRGQRFGNIVDRVFWSAPQGFKLGAGSSNSVRVTGPDGTFVLYDRIEYEESLSPRAFLVDVWAQKYSLLGVETVDVNGFTGATGYLRDVRTRGGARDVRLMAIGLGGGNYARFVLYTKPEVTARMDRPLQDLVYSFRRLRGNEEAEFRPQRIRVVTVASGDTVSGLARRMAVDSLAEDWFRTINGLNPGEGLQAGQQVKLIVNG